MTNYLEKIQVIKQKLRDNGFNDLADDLNDTQMSCGTGGEVLTAICSRLLGIKNRYLDAYSIIRNETEELLNYARSLGYNPWATYKD